MGIENNTNVSNAKPPFPVAAIFVLINAAVGLIDQLVITDSYSVYSVTYIYNIASIVAMIVFAVSLLRRKKDALLVVGPVLILVPFFLAVVLYGMSVYSVVDLLALGAYVLVILMAISVNSSMDLTKVWFIPGILMVIWNAISFYCAIDYGYCYGYEYVIIAAVDILDILTWFFAPFFYFRMKHEKVVKVFAPNVGPVPVYGAPGYPAVGAPVPGYPAVGAPAPGYPVQNTPAPGFPVANAPAPGYPVQNNPAPNFPAQQPAPSYPMNNAAPSQTSAPNGDVVEALKSYKDLLDAGAITQDEFDEKKKMLLNM